MTPFESNKTPFKRHLDPNKTGDLSAARRRVTTSADTKEKASVKPTRRSARGSDVVAREKKERLEARKQVARDGKGNNSVSTGPDRRARNARSGLSEKTKGSQRAAMRFASDNRAVRWFYGLTTGPRRYLFYLAVAILVGAGVYFPVRDFYIAVRTEAILEEQNAIRDTYNETIGSEVESLLSEEGISDAARRDYGMVMPGEKTITVEGLDEDGNPVVVDEGEQGAEGQAAQADGSDATSSQDPSSANGAASKNDEGKLKGEDAADKSKTGSSGSADPSGDSGKTPSTSAEVEAAERAVFENSAWYWKFLDALFFFDGANGMAVVSTGE